jgi:hypothetical protein
MNPLSVRCLHEPADLRALRSEINALNLASAEADPFSTYEFYSNFLARGVRLPQGEVALWFLAVFSDEELVGYLALKRVVRTVLGLSTAGLELLVGHEADRPHLVARAAHFESVGRAVFDYLIQHRREWSWLELQGQGARSALDPTSLGLRLPGYSVRESPNWDNCTIALRWDSVQQYVQSLSKNMRGELRRRLRQLAALGDLELLTSSDPRATPALFDLYCEVEQRSWKSHTEVAIGDAVRAEYVHGLLAAHQPLRMVLQILLLDGVPIAGLISGSFTAATHKTFYALHLTYDARLAAASPGSAVLLMGVRHALEHAHVRLNLLAGFAYYKTRWLAELTPMHSIQIFRKGSLLWWRRMLGDAWRKLQRRPLAVPPSRSSRAQLSDGAVATRPLEVIATKRAQFAAKIAHAHLGVCETLSTAEILASVEVVVQRPTTLQRQPVPRQTSAKLRAFGKLRSA